jgi:hypothetical protein
VSVVLHHAYLVVVLRDGATLTEITICLLILKRRERVLRFRIRTLKRRLGPPDGDGWRVKINYERKDPWDSGAGPE